MTKPVASAAFRTLLLALLTASSGCLGVVLFGNHHGSTSTPQISSKPGLLLEGSDAHVVSDSEVRRAWGEPDEVTKLGDGTERWTYVGGLRWNGVVLVVVFVPIPLLVPVGREQVTIRFRGGESMFGEAIGSEGTWEAFIGWHLHRGWTAMAGGQDLARIPDIDLGRESR
jgi:hypothetical protein